MNSRFARYLKVIHTNQEFNVNQDLKGASFDGQFVYQAWNWKFREFYRKFFFDNHKAKFREISKFSLRSLICHLAGKLIKNDHEDGFLQIQVK